MLNSQVRMKLLIDTKGRRVLFAEAGKECVDFLFHILSLPVATIIRLLKDQEMAGSLPNLYQSLETLNDADILPNQKKDNYLKPLFTSSVPLLPLADANQRHTEFYRCYNCVNPNYISNDPRATCPSCHRLINLSVTYVAPPSAVKVAPKEGGLVKDVVTYMVMDDLMIMPTMSIICSITMLNSKFNIQDISSLEEKVVTMGNHEALKLLKASMQINKVLTDVFF